MFARLKARGRKRFEMFAALTMLFSQVVFPLAVATPVSAQVGSPPDPVRVAICQAVNDNGSSGDGYNSIEVNENAVDSNGNSDHTLQVGDIIPEPYNGDAGRSPLSAADEARLANNCQPTRPPAQASVTVVKEVVGGDALPGDFDLIVNDTVVPSGQSVRVPADEAVALSEAGAESYILTSVICKTANGRTVDVTDTLSITPPARAQVTCTFTNTYEEQEIEGTIAGRKYDDSNENGTFQSRQEARLDGWDIRLYDAQWQLVDSDTTAGNGKYEFDDLAAGSYYVCEVSQAGWVQTGPLLGAENVDNSGDVSGGAEGVSNQSANLADEGGICWEVTVDANNQEIKNVKFGNTNDLADLMVRKFNDVNANSQYDNEKYLNGWTVNVYDDQWSLVETGETSGNGAVTFRGLLLGDYFVCEVAQDGWSQSNPNETNGVENQSGNAYEADRCFRAVLDEVGETKSRRFGNYQSSQIVITKYEDIDLDGPDRQDPTVSDWTIRFYDEQWDELYSNTTNQDGKIRLGNLSLGTYYVCEALTDNWQQVFPEIGRTTVENQSTATDEATVCHRVDITEGGSTTERVFFNIEPGKIRVKKFHDLNGNSERDGGEPLIAGWTIKVFDSNDQLVNEKETKDNGWVRFNNLEPGTYLVCEEQVDGWIQTVPRRGGPAPDESDFSCVDVEIDESGEKSDVIFGNYELSILQGRKYLDVNQDGDHDRRGAGERRMNDWEIRLYDANWELLEESLTGDDSDNYGDVGRGQYRFAVRPGTYYTCEVLQYGWAQTGPNIGDTRNGAVAVANSSSGANEGEVCWQSTVETAAQRFTGLKFGNVDFATITVNKEIRDDDGGTLGQDSFTYLINDEQYTNWGEEVQVDVGRYSIGEVDPASLGYKIEDISCRYRLDEGAGIRAIQAPLGTSFDLKAGDNIVCTIINDDMPAEITVIKHTNPPYSQQEFDFTVSQDDEVVDEFSLVGSRDRKARTDQTIVPADSNMNGNQPGRHTTLVGAGVITVEEEPVEDWYNGVYVSCWLVEYYSSDNEASLIGGYYQYVEQVFSGYDVTEAEFDVELGEKIHCNFYNSQPSEITVTKFNDIDQDGFFDESEDEQEEVLSGWEINLHEFDQRMDPVEAEAVTAEVGSYVPPVVDTQTTDENGQVVFEDLNPGFERFRYAISENQQEGWTLSNIYCDYGDLTDIGAQIGARVASQDYINIGTQVFPVFVYPGAEIECFIGNYADADLELSKTNDRPQPTVNGDTVTYTLIVKVPQEAGCVFGSTSPFKYASNSYGYGGPMHCDSDGPDGGLSIPSFVDYEEMEPMTGEAVTVTDLPPEGFEYVSGSWTATSSVRGDLKASGVTTEPTYASPGIWQLTNAGSTFLTPGEVIVLTYQALISGQPNDGSHPDTAFARGFAANLAELFANVSTSDNPFVGTSVLLATADTPVSEGVVLGLANTGGFGFIAPLVGAAIAAIALIPVAFDRKNRAWKRRFTSLLKATTAPLLILGMALTLTIASAAPAHAFERWDVKVFEPTSPTTDGTFNLNYQILSVDESDTFTVNVRQDGAVVASDTITTAFGDSKAFPIALTADGTYGFQIEATSALNGDTQTSSVETVTLDTVSPEAIQFGSKSQSGSSFDLAFTVPSGSDATTVAVYTSTLTSFTANDSTQVGEVTATPGSGQTFNYSAPTGDTYYFAVQAVDAAGNRSALAAETVATVTDDTATAATTATAVIVASGDATAAPTAAEIEAAGDVNGDGVVDAADVAALNDDASDDDQISDEGEVLSGEDNTSETEEESSSVVIWIIVAAGAAAGAFYLYRSRQTQ